MNKQQLVASLELDEETNKELMKHTVADIKWAIALTVPSAESTPVEDASNDPSNEGDEIEPTGASKVPETYRKKYAERAREQGRKAKTAGGRATLNNGDELALLLESADHAQTCAIADTLLERDMGATFLQYTTDRLGQTHPKTGEPLKVLNNGMVRMNAGNRIRSFVKKSDKPEAVIAQIRAMTEDKAE